MRNKGRKTMKGGTEREGERKEVKRNDEGGKAKKERINKTN